MTRDQFSCAGRAGVFGFMGRRVVALAMLCAACVAVPASAAAFVAAREFPARIVAAHNAERMQAGMPPLTWDAALANGAALYAQQLAFTGVFAHSDRSKR